MLGFKTSESYASQHCLLRNVGVSSFNKQHLRLASYAVEFNQIIEDLSSREPTQEDWRHIDALYSRISLYIAVHFKEEEELMQQHEYPNYPAHKRQHDKFVDEMGRVQSQINNRNVKFKGTLSNLLWNWLYVHINEMDYEYRDFFLERGVK